jgi:hypothetical protein
MNNTNIEILNAEEEKELHFKNKIYDSLMPSMKLSAFIEAFDYNEKQNQINKVIAYKQVKERKLYKGAPYTDENGVNKLTNSLKEYCQFVIKQNYSSIEEQLKNFNMLGAKFIEAGETIGFTRQMYRQIRQASSDEKAQLIDSEAFKTGDVDALKEQLEDLTDKHASEKQVLEAKVTEVTRLANVRDTLVKGATAEAQAAKVQLAEALEAQQYSPTKWLKNVQQINLASTKLLGDISHALSQLLDLNETVSTELMNDQHGDTALEMMATVQLHNVNEVFMLANNLSFETRERFSAFTTRARAMHTEEEILALEQELLAQL